MSREFNTLLGRYSFETMVDSRKCYIVPFAVCHLLCRYGGYIRKSKSPCRPLRLGVNLVPTPFLRQYLTDHRRVEWRCHYGGWSLEQGIRLNANYIHTLSELKPIAYGTFYTRPKSNLCTVPVRSFCCKNIGAKSYIFIGRVLPPALIDFLETRVRQGCSWSGMPL